MKQHWESIIKSDEVIEIDGSIGEGGGSILRVAAGICCYSGKKLVINSIRKNRTPPGLKLQHLLGINALRDITSGEVIGGEMGSMRLSFNPGTSWKNQLKIKVDTAGSVGLLTQTLQYGLLGAPSGEYTFDIEGGGTYGKGAPDPFLLNNTTFWLFDKLGYNVHIDVKDEGFYPKGGANSTIRIKVPDKISGFTITESGKISKVGTRICVSSQLKNKNVGERIEKVIKRESSKLQLPAEYEIIVDYVNTRSPGVGVSGYIQYENGAVKGTGTILGGIKITSEQLGMNYANELRKIVNDKAGTDVWTADQLIPLMPLCETNPAFTVGELSLHTKTNIEIAEMFFRCKYSIKKLDKFWQISLKKD